MAEYALASPRRRLLLDPALAPDAESLAAIVAVLGERELGLLGPGGKILPASSPAPAGTDVEGCLASLEGAIPLDDALLVSRRETLLAWARQRGVATLAPAGDESLATLLGPGALVLRDAASLLLRAKRRKEDRPFLVGVNGMNNAGKSEFAARLAAQLGTLGFAPQVVSLDAFTAPKKARRPKDYPEAEAHYRKHYAMERLQAQLLRPFPSGPSGVVEFDVYDPVREKIVEKRQLSLDRRSMVIVEGLYLYQEEYFSTFDYRIYLVTDFERAIDLELSGIDEPKRRERTREDFLRCELAAQSIYLRQESPWRRAHLVLRDVNGDEPRIENSQPDA